MASQLIDSGLETITATTLEVTSNPDFLTCISAPGTPEADLARSDLMGTILMKQLSFDFIDKIHLIPRNNSNSISTANAENVIGEKIYEDLRTEFKPELSATLKSNRWGASHPFTDGLYKLQDANYAGFLCTEVAYGGTEAFILIDVSSKKISETLAQISLGEGSIIGYHTKEGKEMQAANLM